MKFVISSSDLLNHLQSLVKVINSKSTYPALDNFLLKLKGNELTLTASDLDTTLTTVVELDNAEGEGVIGIDARRLLSTIKEFNEPLTFSIDTESCSVDIISEKGKYSLVGMNGEEYPVIPELTPDNAQSINLTSDALVSSINATLFATSDDEIRPVMTGIYLGFRANEMVAAGSDSHKLVRYKRLDVKTADPATLILPKKPAGLLRSLLPKDETPVEILVDAKNAQMRFATVTLTCRLIEGMYPDFETIIPVELPYKLTIDKANLQSVLRRVSIYSSQSVQLVKLDITSSEVNVSAQDLDFSISANERLNCVYEGDDMSIGFKSTFLIEILQNLTGREINIGLMDPTRSILLSPAENENENEQVVMLLMPISIEG